MSRHTELPRRPALPTTLYALVVVLVVERSMLGENVPWLAGWSGRLTACAIAALLVMSCVLGRQRLVLVFIAMAALFSLTLSSLCVERISAATDALTSVPVSCWSYRIEGDPTKTDDGYRYRACVEDAGLLSSSVWLQTAELLDTGTELRGVGRFIALGDNEWAQTSRAQGICGTVFLYRLSERRLPVGLQGWIDSMRRRVIELVAPSESDERALVAGCVCAWRLDLRERKLNELFSRCGVAHLVAVSGSHLAIAAGMLDALLLAGRVRPKRRALCVVLISCLFVLLCGAPISAIRALSMSAASVVGGLRGRRAHSLSAVCVVGIGMALWDPTLSGSLSFVLSIISVSGLCVFGAYGEYALDVMVPRLPTMRRLPKVVRRGAKKAEAGARQSVGAALVAQMVTLPIVGTAFGEVSLVGPIANAFVAVPFLAMVAAGLLASVLWWLPPLQNVALIVADLSARTILALLRVVDTLPVVPLRVATDSLLPYASVVLTIVILVVWPRLSRRRILCVAGALSCVGALLFARWRFMAPARICVLDVGQGDAILVQEGANAILVDAGPDEAVVDALARQHVTHLDAVVLTHLHADHYEGIADLVGRVGCEKVVVANGVEPNMGADVAAMVRAYVGNSVEEIGYSDCLRLGNFELEVVSPVAEVDGSLNAHSLMLLVSYSCEQRYLTALLTGDAERDETQAALERGDLCDIDVLKVGHHGSEVSITPEQALQLDPELSVASAGEGNSYHHPRRECVDVLNAAGSEFLCTKDVGDVEVRPGKEGPEVRTQRHGFDVQ